MTTIQKNINPENGKQNLGYEHFMDEVETTRWVREWQANTRDLSEDINYFISLMS
jgi:hypothetical protein